MKTLRKLIMGLLVSIMVLGMGVAAYAASGSITITGAVENQEYKAYRVFDYFPADEASPDAGGVYKLASEFSGFQSYAYEGVSMSSLFTVGDNGIIDTSGLTSEADAKVFGKAALAYAEANGIGPAYTTIATKDGDATFENTEYGYYVLNSSLGSVIAVNTTTPNAELKEKNEVPGLDKTITGATNEALIYEDLTDADHQIGDTVEFTVEAVLKKGGLGYVIHDCVTKGLTLNPVTDANITFEPSDDGITTSIDNTYTEDGKKGFEVTFDGEPQQDTTVKIVYTAVINEEAVVSPSQEINKAQILYGREGKGVPKETRHKTYPIAIRKTAVGADKLLKDAKFEIYRELDNSQVKLTKVSDTKYRVDPDGTTTEIVTVEADNIVIEGLAPEKYVLVETQAPVGYNLLESEVAVGSKTYKHAQEVVVSKNSTSEAIQVEKVEDGTGLTLPSTGGIGTTIFYIVGGILIVAGIAYFIVRRKADAE